MDDPRYPLHIRILGIMYKDNDKLYMTSVLWSDQSELLVYRSLLDFRQLHRQLKKSFPVEASKGRVLPRFGGVTMKMVFHRKIPVRCTHRIMALERYLTELLRCEPRISQSANLVRFFLPKEEEMSPEFVQDSVMVFQPGQSGVNLTHKPQTTGSITQPLVTKVYRTVAPYETKDIKNRPFKVTVDETLEVLIKDQAGWWLVENEEKRLAWFPAPYLELCGDQGEEEEEEEDHDLDTTQVQPSLYCAVRNYTPESRDELPVSIGCIVEVLQKSDTGWWFARYNGKTGFVPSKYLQPYTHPTLRLHMKLHGSILNLASLPNHLSHTGRKSQSVATLSDLADLDDESNSRKSSCSVDTQFSSSSSTSLGLSLSDSVGGDAATLECDSGLASRSPNESESSTAPNLYPQVPPRPRTQEILSRCTTYTRRAALETQARLFLRSGSSRRSDKRGKPQLSH